MHINAGILFSGVLIMASVAAAPITTSTEIGRFQPLIVGPRASHSESSRQGVQHTRLIRHLQPATNGQASNDSGDPEKAENHH
ncbi:MULTISPECIES: hypothetical protein [Enterobacter cloacae complex]|uniref:hypothetical protein n=1 Tax=Enterobacter cloacae complex TaxID=354276 RepID=UPI0021CE7044|nr:hypothetical protein [Enterobacter asburiae]MCU6243783.1 hypothetical protein [Enterobacter asburiae]